MKILRNHLIDPLILLIRTYLPKDLIFPNVYSNKIITGERIITNHRSVFPLKDLKSRIKFTFKFLEQDYFCVSLGNYRLYAHKPAFMKINKSPKHYEVEYQVDLRENILYVRRQHYKGKTRWFIRFQGDLSELYWQVHSTSKTDDFEFRIESEDKDSIIVP